MEFLIEDDYEIEEIENFNLNINTPIILCLDIQDKNFPKKLIKSLKHGFNHPIVHKNNLYLYIRYTANFGKKCKEWKDTLNLIKFTINNYIDIVQNPDHEQCNIYISLGQDALRYLNNYSQKYKFHSIEHARPEQKEISGVFSLKPLSKQNFLVSILDDKTDIGDKEESKQQLVNSSFHTHPLEAYVKYNVCAAWPSYDDYITFLYVYANGYGFFHIVACVEGIYVITISDSLMKIPRDEILGNFTKYKNDIEKNYTYSYPSCKKEKQILYSKIQKYVTDINKHKYFIVKFLEWKQAGQIIPIKYKRENGNCFITDEQSRFNQYLQKRAKNYIFKRTTIL
jgi:hypothetical protein